MPLGIHCSLYANAPVPIAIQQSIEAAQRCLTAPRRAARRLTLLRSAHAPGRMLSQAHQHGRRKDSARRGFPDTSCPRKNTQASAMRRGIGEAIELAGQVTMLTVLT
jgi:hypothetical protein